MGDIPMSFCSCFLVILLPEVVCSFPDSGDDMFGVWRGWRYGEAFISRSLPSCSVCIFIASQSHVCWDPLELTRGALQSLAGAECVECLEGSLAWMEGAHF